MGGYVGEFGLSYLLVAGIGVPDTVSPNYSLSRPPCQWAGRAYFLPKTAPKTQNVLTYPVLFVIWRAVKFCIAIVARGAGMPIGIPDTSPRPPHPACGRVRGSGFGSPRGGGRSNPAPAGPLPQPLLIVIVAIGGQPSRDG